MYKHLGILYCILETVRLIESSKKNNTNKWKLKSNEREREREREGDISISKILII